jgi:serine protease Do
MMTKLKAPLGLIPTLMLMVAAVAAAPAGPFRVFPFPVVETEQVIGGWLRSSGYQLLRDDAASGETHLIARKGDEDWRIVLKPSSPLLTEVSGRYTLAGTTDTAKLEELWLVLGNHTNSLRMSRAEADGDLPKWVLQQVEAGVCLETNPGPGHLQLSGFFFDESGLILTTAHNLEQRQALTVIAQDGQRALGRTIKVDPLRDLALIQASLKPLVIVSLAKSRLGLDLGEKVYAIGCPRGAAGDVRMGTVNSPPRLANAMPLWQIDLNVLPGSSGSPVFDTAGNLVGVIKGRYRGTGSVGFLIPLTTVMEFLGG